MGEEEPIPCPHGRPYERCTDCFAEEYLAELDAQAAHRASPQQEPPALSAAAVGLADADIPY